MNLTNKVVFSKNSKFTDVLNADVAIKEIFVDINLNSRAVKYKKTKLIKFSSVEIVKISKKLKKLTQIIKEESNSVNVIKQILNTFIEIRFHELLNIFFELFKQMFCSIIDEEIKTISKKNHCTIKKYKRKKVHVDSIRSSSTESMYLREIVARIIFLRFIYVVVCSIVSVMIENIKIKTLFNSGIKVNYMFKQLIDAAQLFMRQSIKIIMINSINERACFFDMCETVFININNITISIFVFVIKRLDYKFLLEKFFQRAACMSFVNMNNKSFKMILHSLNEKNE